MKTLRLKPVGFSLGFMKEEPHLFTASPGAFGHPGAGGTLGWCDPAHELSIGYVMNKMDFYGTNDPREVALREAMYRCIDDIEGGK